jgi:hypothetical protein
VSSLPSLPPPAPFVIVARLSAHVESRLHRLGGHVALLQRGTGVVDPWSLTLIGPDGRTTEISKAVRARTGNQSMQLLSIGGSGPADAWLVTSHVVKSSATAYAIKTWRVSSDSLKLTNGPGYRFVGEFRQAQWVGVPIDAHLGSRADSPPRTFRNLTGEGVPPELPPNFSLFDASFLGEERACGLGASIGDSSDTIIMAFWMTSPEGMRVVPLGPLDQAARTLAVGHECVILLPDKSGTTFKRLRGNTLTAVRIAEQASVASGTSDASIWIVHNRALARVSLTEEAARAKEVPLARTAACSGSLEVSDVVARADNDVWITAGCDTAKYLLHTQAAPPLSVATLPVP